MKKIHYIATAIALMLVTACSGEEENLFDQSSAQRADAAIVEYNKLLTGASEGWLMQYFPASGQPYGGYNLWVKFDDHGKASVRNELKPDSIESTGLYQVKQSAGIVLSFDTYSELIHIFADPTDRLGGAGNAFGMEGDYDFLFIKATPELILLKNKKSGNYTTLTPMKESWKSFDGKVKKIQEDMFLGTFNVVVKGENVGTLAQSNHTYEMTSTDDKGVPVTKLLPFIYTTDGIQLYEPLTINGVTMSKFTANAADMTYTCSDAGVDAKLTPFYPKGYRSYDELVGTYSMTATDLISKETFTRSVEVEANTDKQTYTLTGFYSEGTVQATYNRLSGTMEIVMQRLPDFLGYYVFLCSFNGSRYTWAEAAGMIGMNSDGDTLTITFVDNGRASFEVTAFLAYAFTSLPPTGSAGAGYVECIGNPVLTKQ